MCSSTCSINFLCKQNTSWLRLQCQSLRWNSKFGAATELWLYITQQIIFVYIKNCTQYTQWWYLLPCQKVDLIMITKSIFSKKNKSLIWTLHRKLNSPNIFRLATFYTTAPALKLEYTTFWWFISSITSNGMPRFLKNLPDFHSSCQYNCRRSANK